jgi:hypothetical protein
MPEPGCRSGIHPFLAAAGFAVTKPLAPALKRNPIPAAAWAPGPSIVFVLPIFFEKGQVFRRAVAVVVHQRVFHFSGWPWRNIPYGLDCHIERDTAGVDQAARLFILFRRGHSGLYLDPEFEIGKPEIGKVADAVSETIGFLLVLVGDPEHVEKDGPSGFKPAAEISTRPIGGDWFQEAPLSKFQRNRGRFFRNKYNSSTTDRFFEGIGLAK